MQNDAKTVRNEPKTAENTPKTIRKCPKPKTFETAGPTPIEAARKRFRVVVRNIPFKECTTDKLRKAFAKFGGNEHLRSNPGSAIEAGPVDSVSVSE